MKNLKFFGVVAALVAGVAFYSILALSASPDDEVLKNAPASWGK